MIRLVLVLLLEALLIVPEGIAATVKLTGKVTELWSEETVGDVAVTVANASGDILGEARTDAKGEYSIERLPQNGKRVEVKYQLDDWQKHPTRHYVKLDRDAIHDKARLCKTPQSQHEAAAAGKLLYSVEAAGKDTSDARAILAGMPANVQSTIARAYATEMLRLSDPSRATAEVEARKLLARISEASLREIEREWHGRIGAFADELADYAKVRQLSPDTLVLTVNDSYFASADDEVSPRAKRLYRGVVEYLRNPAVRQVIVEGHADSAGPATLNQRLADNRAGNVSDILIESGVPSEKVLLKGTGESPVTTTAGRPNPLDRRVDLILRFNVPRELAGAR